MNFLTKTKLREYSKIIHIELIDDGRSMVAYFKSPKSKKGEKLAPTYSSRLAVEQITDLFDNGANSVLISNDILLNQAMAYLWLIGNELVLNNKTRTKLDPDYILGLINEGLLEGSKADVFFAKKLRRRLAWYGVPEALAFETSKKFVKQPEEIQEEYIGKVMKVCDHILNKKKNKSLKSKNYDFTK